MVIILAGTTNAQYLCTDTTKRHINAVESKIWRIAGVVLIDTEATPAERDAFLAELTLLT